MLEGKFIEADVKHETYTKDDGTEGTGARFSEKSKGTPFAIKRAVKPEVEEEPVVEDESSEELDWLNF